ncbi:MAG: hypothetical protein R2747_05980 [Pyrinomonadaceae bacterium]
MLFCPKCQATYEDGTQRFCTNEGTRLLPFSSSDNPQNQSAGVFTSILGKSVAKSGREKSRSAEQESVGKSGGQSRVRAFQPPTSSKFFNPREKQESAPRKEEPKLKTKEERAPEKDSFQPLPLARIIDPGNIPEKRAEARAEKAAQPLEIPELPEKTSGETDEIFDLSSEKDETPSEDYLLEPIDLPDEKEFARESLLEVPGEVSEAVSPELEIGPIESENLIDIPALEVPGFTREERIEAISARLAETDLKAEGAGEIELDLPEPKVAPPAPVSGFELELDEIEDVSIPGDKGKKFEIDLEDPADAFVSPENLPEIELELEEIKLPEVEEPVVSPEPVLEKEELELPHRAKEPSETSEESDQTSDLTAQKADERIEEKPAVKVPKMVTPPPETIGEKATSDPVWEKQLEKSRPPQENRWYMPILAGIIGLIILGLGIYGLMKLMGSNAGVKESDQPLNENLAPQLSRADNPIPETGVQPLGSDPEIGAPKEKMTRGDAPPPVREVPQPPDTVYYKNKKSDQRGELARNFLGFSIFYPKGWVENKADGKFLDISKKSRDGFPIKQLLITRYDSQGTFDGDLKIFDDLVEKSNIDLKKIFWRDYQVVFKGETTIQNGRWRAYEVKFQGLSGDGKLKIWGRRLWLPVQRPGMKSGFIITLLATSLAEDVKGVEDVGVNDDLATILETFEPDLQQK